MPDYLFSASAAVGHGPHCRSTETLKDRLP